MVLARILVLKMEYEDIINHERFPHFSTHKYMTKIYYEETRVTQLEPMKWLRGVKQARLLHMLYVKKFHMSIINTVCVHLLLTLAHDGFLWPNEPILLMAMPIHWITKLPYKGWTLPRSLEGIVEKRS